jgi:hypothetical protein
MWNKFTDYYFWFSQPSSFLSNEDWLFAYISGGLIVFGVIFYILSWLSKNPVDKTVFKKIWRLGITIGLSGLVWFGIRYENTPMFSQHFWMGLNLLVGLVWLVFILKYLFFKYREAKNEYSREMLKSKYLPQKR